MRRSVRDGAFTALLIALVWAGCSAAWAGTLEGIAAYRERIALPPDAVFEAELQDVSRADAPATVLGRATLDPSGQPPFRFQIPYDDAAVQPRRRYVVRATVRQQGRLLFTTDQAYPVLAGGPAAPFNLLLVSTRGGASLSSRTLTGTFTYMADAPSIRLCADGSRIPVAMEADYKALEAAYLRERRQPGEALLVSLDGLIASRPSMEASRPPQPSLVVERFIGIWPRETCGTPLADSPLRNTYWKLVRLGDAPVRAAENQREPHVILALGQPRVTGSGGCNRLIGRFELDGDTLRFRGFAGTMMACPAGMEQEQRFLEALGKVERYRISGSHREMLDATGAVLARLEAVALR